MHSLALSTQYPLFILTYPDGYDIMMDHDPGYDSPICCSLQLTLHARHFQALEMAIYLHVSTHSFEPEVAE